MSFLCTYGQVLSDVTLDLNSGGEVYDVAFDEYRDLYIIVGNFNSVQGQSRNNFAILDGTSLQLSNENPITQINGVIRAVEIAHWSTQGQMYEFVYIGGDFTSINGNNNNNWSQRYLARLSFATGNLNSSSYSLNNWDPNNYFYDNGQWPGVGVNDLLITGDTLIAIGAIDYEDPINYYSSILGFSAGPGTAASTHLQNFFFNYSPGEPGSCGDINFGNDHWNICEANAGFYINGNMHFDYNGVFTNFNYDFDGCGSVTCNMYDITIHESSQDTIVFGFKRYAASSGLVAYELDGS